MYHHIYKITPSKPGISQDLLQGTVILRVIEEICLGKSLQLELTSIQLREHREVKEVPTQNLHLYRPVFVVLGDAIHDTQGER